MANWSLPTRCGRCRSTTRPPSSRTGSDTGHSPHGVAAAAADLTLGRSPAPAHREKKVEGESNLCFTSYTFYLRVINPLCFGGGARTYRLLYSDDTFSCWRQPIEHDDLDIRDHRESHIVFDTPPATAGGILLLAPCPSRGRTRTELADCHGPRPAERTRPLQTRPSQAPPGRTPRPSGQHSCWHCGRRVLDTRSAGTGNYAARAGRWPRNGNNSCSCTRRAPSRQVCPPALPCT